MNTSPHIQKIIFLAAACLGFLAGVSGLKADVLYTIYTDDNFAAPSYTDDWTFYEGTGTGHTLEASVPLDGANTQSLNLTDTSASANIDVRLGFSSYTGTDRDLEITFDFKMTHTINGGTGQNELDILRFGLLDSSNTTVGSLVLGAHNGGGSASSRLSWANSGGWPVSALIDPDAWYRYTMTVPAVGEAGDITSYIVGLDGADVYSPDSPYGPVSSASFTIAKNNSVADYAALKFYEATDSSYLDANLANISVGVVPEPATGLIFVLVSLMALRRK